VGYAPYDIILWDADEEKLLRILEGHSNWVVSLAFSPDGKLLISGAGDSTARIWSVEAGKEIGRIRLSGSCTYVHSVGFSPDGKKAFALTEDNYLRIVDVPDPGQLH
jgi:WD40 repeat protein